jgi:hypothetical protein
MVSSKVLERTWLQGGGKPPDFGARFLAML